MCLLISLTIVSMATTIPTTKADTYVMPLYGSTWEITAEEESAAEWVVDKMEYYYATHADYTTYDLFGNVFCYF
ncbi:MAG: hypothetical protein ACOC6H_00500 [Thermoproteota archaeon]